jgi:lipoprotein-releasing system permease protein
MRAMAAPLEWFIGLRYLRARRRTQYVSFISLASMIGVALGVASLIVILSVMNGFESELRNRLLSMTAHINVSQAEGPLRDWRVWSSRFEALPGVEHVAPYVAIQGMLASGRNLNAVLVRGVIPQAERKMSRVSEFMLEGSLDDLKAGEGNVIIGRVLAIKLGVGVGDRVRLLVPQIRAGRLTPKLTSFTVSGVFEAGIQDHDDGLALIHLGDAGKVYGWEESASAIGLSLADPLKATQVGELVRSLLTGDLVYSDWTIENRSYFRAIRIEKTMMTVLLLLIVAVAAFNIVASLVMVVTDKEQDIAILRTMGLAPQRVGRIFVFQGAIIGLVGVVVGVALGLVLTTNVDIIVPWLEQTFGFQIMPGDVYYVTAIPAEIHWLDVVMIPTVAFVLTLAATLYPSRRAAAVAPARALRYE